MRKLFLFFTAFFLLTNSCSSDESYTEETTPAPQVNGNKGTLTVKINGELTTFNTIYVSEYSNDYIFGWSSAPLLKVTASQDNDPTKKIITFYLKKGVTENPTILGGEYFINGVWYESFSVDATVNMTVSNDHRLTGTFTVPKWFCQSFPIIPGDPSPVNYITEYFDFTEGSFDINYGYSVPEPTISKNMITAKVNGVYTTFENFTVKDDPVFPEENWQVTGTQTNNPNTKIIMKISKYAGTSHAHPSISIENQQDGSRIGGMAISIIRMNTNNKIIGSFVIEKYDSERFDITDGHFEIDINKCAIQK